MSNVSAISSRKLALACADFLWRQDATLRNLGLEDMSIKAGQATVGMTVLPSMVNGLGHYPWRRDFHLRRFGFFACRQYLQ